MNSSVLTAMGSDSRRGTRIVIQRVNETAMIRLSLRSKSEREAVLGFHVPSRL